MAINLLRHFDSDRFSIPINLAKLREEEPEMANQKVQSEAHKLQSPAYVPPVEAQRPIERSHHRRR